MGYNTTGSSATASGTVSGYYALTGCRDFNNVTDRGCNQEVRTAYHVYLEAWTSASVSDWEHIQTAYSSMAPRNLGSMGYVGSLSTFLPRSIQAQAYSTKGKALQFFRSWNASWNQPSDFFDSISSVSTSKLVPCNKPGSAMTNDPMLRRHVKWTGDSDGVLINNEPRLPCCSL